MPDIAKGQGGAPPPATMMDAVRDLSRSFREAGLPTPERDALLLVLAASGFSHEDYVLAPGRQLSDEAGARIQASRCRRLAREPVSRIVGSRAFWGRDFAIDASTLDPRPETETLIEAVLGILDEEGRRGAPLRILDLGTGTGCILLSLLAELPQASGVGVDIDRQALAIAARNAATHGLASRALFCCGDWTAQFSGSFDVIASNPPYIRHSDIPDLDPEVRFYDPHGALDGGPDGYDAYRRIARETLRVASAGALLALEAGAGQMPHLIELVMNSGWCAERSSYRVYADLLGHDRVVAVRKQR